MSGLDFEGKNLHFGQGLKHKNPHKAGFLHANGHVQNGMSSSMSSKPLAALAGAALATGAGRAAGARGAL